ncbi:MAG: DUF2269 domain-containing protein [Sphingomonadales bacterium]|nr:DUF2269 domain-containing protein [Sphingomonadales bacterium]
MDLYSIVKVLHIISATILFGTGIGIAFFMLMGVRSKEPGERRYAARFTVVADFTFTLPAVILQPLTGAWLVWQGGFIWTDYWLVVTYALYMLAGVCWIPVVYLQIAMKRMLDRQAIDGIFDERAFNRLFRWWFALGWPAFGGLIVIFGMMVMKPTW